MTIPSYLRKLPSRLPRWQRDLLATALTVRSELSVTHLLPSGRRGTVSRALVVNSKKLCGTRPFLQGRLKIDWIPRELPGHRRNMTIGKAHITFFVVTAGQYVAIGHPAIVENIHRGVRTFRAVSNGLFFAKHNLASRRTDAGVFEWMPRAEVVDGSYAIALAAGVEAPTVHRVTLIIGPVGSVA